MEGRIIIIDQFMTEMNPRSHREAVSQWLLAWSPGYQSDPGQQRRSRGRERGRHQKQLLLPKKTKKSV